MCPQETSKININFINGGSRTTIVYDGVNMTDLGKKFKPTFTLMLFQQKQLANCTRQLTFVTVNKSHQLWVCPSCM